MSDGTTSFWHPFANMGALSRAGAVTIVRGQGSTVWDDRGAAYLDAMASLWYCNVGHGRGEIADAAADQIRALAAYQTFERYTSPAVEALTARIAAISPMPGTKVFLTSGGSESVDTAAKLARSYWRATGKPSKQVLISREHAYHGMNAYGTSLAGIPSNLEAFHPLVESVEHVAWDDSGALAEAIDRHGADRVAAFFCEPVIGAGGVIAPPEGYLAEVARICRERDVLLVADEVVSAYGRLGSWFACDRYGLVPDMITTAKGLTSGYAPLGAVLIGERVAEPYWREGTAEVFRHGYTYSGHTTSCAVAVASLDILEREDLLARVSALEPVLRAALRPLAEHELVAEVRAGVGLLGAVELTREALGAGLLQPIVDAMRERGVLSRGVRGVALQFSPPFVVTEDEIARMAAATGEALNAAAVAA